MPASPRLLEAGLTAWIAAQGAAVEAFSLDPIPAGTKPALHARLRHSLSEDSEDEEHWSFRAISAPHHIAVLNRIRNAITTAGLTEGVAKRRLFLLRSAEWSTGARTREVLDAFERAGGRRLPLDAPDVARLAALEQLIQDYGRETLRPWFADRRPASDITCLREALGDWPGAPEAVRTEERPAEAPDRLPVGTPPPVTAAPRSAGPVPAPRSAGSGPVPPMIAPLPPVAGIDPERMEIGTVTAGRTRSPSTSKRCAGTQSSSPAPAPARPS
ncbi:hypothetical protein [Micromonospora sp. b486]|uniref:hypothetical protein n=1 Tax=Micromonospora sp. b486 TaxID=3053986 RepID=UPI00259C9DB6|nr:hypothetical protein [Micromonospora sp. b486]MDM4784642.1 hypothetical protein [Micromonospora sp. b486]